MSMIRALLVAVIVLGLLQSSEPKAILEITLSKAQVTSKEPLVLEVVLRNSGTEPFFVCGEIIAGRTDPVCGYELQIRSAGDSVFRSTPQMAGDRFPLNPTPPTVEEFKDEHNVILLKPDRFLGTRHHSTWVGLTAVSPGNYELRVVYVGGLRIPVMLDRTFLRGPISSNVVRIRVLP